MKNLSPDDQKILQLLSEGLADREICLKLNIDPETLEASVRRIEARAVVESDDAGRFYERSLRLRTERKIVSLNARFTALMDILPQGVLVVDGRTGLVKEFNQKACELFGYRPEEMLGLSVEELVPEGKRAIHPAYRLGFLASIRKREMGYHPPIFGVRRDGAKIEMAIALTATTADDDVMVVCSDFAIWESAQGLEESESNSHQTN